MATPHRWLKSLIDLRAIRKAFMATEEPALQARKRLHITRISALFLAALGPIFITLNLNAGHHLLALINLINSLIGLLCLLLVRKKLHFPAALSICLLLPPFFITAGLLYRNGIEYNLLLVMTGAVFMFNSHLLRLSLCLLSGAGFLLIRIVLFNPLESALSLGRFTTNMVIFLLCYYSILELFRSLNISYQKTIIEKNEHLEQLTRKLEAANLAKEKIFRIVSHDLRGPVGNLQSTLELLANDDLSTSDFRELLPQLETELRGAGNCLNTLLHWSSGQLADIQPVFVRIPLRDLKADLQAQFTEPYSRKQVSLHYEIPEGAIVHADRDLLSIVIRNLLSNALKFTPEGGSVILRAEREEHSWKISIQDTGVGISEDLRATILNPLSFYSSRGTEGERGTGLGLRICNEMLQTLGSTLQVSSRSHEGSCFYFTLSEGRPLGA